MKFFLNQPVRMLLLAALFISTSLSAKPWIYQVRMYTLENEQQEAMMDNYLEHAYLPALHRAGIDEVGVFKTIEGKNDGENLVVVFIPLKSMNSFDKLTAKLDSDAEFQRAAVEFRDASYDQPPYKRLEVTLLKAFSETPVYSKPELTTMKDARVYELRSYESATEELHRRKVKMFNDGESQLFEDLGFEPLFFGQVIAGAHMPNLVYMTCHANTEAQSANWKAFVDHPEWNRMKVLDEYQNTVSHIDKWMLYPAEYSDL